MSEELSLLIFLTSSLSVGLFTFSFYFSCKYSENKLVRNIGFKLFESKIKMSRGTLFQYIIEKTESGQTAIPLLILTVIIFIKSVGMFLTGLVFIGPILLCLQGFMMGSLKTEMIKRGINENFGLVITTQLSGHILALSLGLSLCWKRVNEGKSLFNLYTENKAAVTAIILLTLCSAIITAFYETRMLKRKGMSLFN